MRVNKNFIINAMIYAFIAIMCAVFQTNILNPVKIFTVNVKPNLIISLVIAASIFEGEKYGSVFGFICGFCFDTGFGSPFMMSGIFYFAAAYIVGAVTKIYFKKSLITMIIAILPVCFIKEVINLFYLVATWDRFQIADAGLRYILPEYIYTVILAFPMYFLIKFTAGRISHKVI